MSFKNNPSGSRPLTAGRVLRILVAFFGATIPLVLCFLLKPTAARAAWAELSRMIQRQGPAFDPQTISDAKLAALRPQQQAELLLDAAIDRSPEAADKILARASSWRGHLTRSTQLAGLLNTALSSDDTRVRAAGVESELAANNLAKTSRSAKELIARIERETAARPWGLWMLGALGNRGVEPEQASVVLARYARDGDEKTRYWAVEGLGLLGKNESVQYLLTALRDDPSPEVRERAACALAQSGTLTRQQRMNAVPSLIEYAGDSSVDPVTHTLVYHALRDITGANVDDNADAWRTYWATETGSR